MGGTELKMACRAGKSSDFEKGPGQSGPGRAGCAVCGCGSRKGGVLA